MMIFKPWKTRLLAAALSAAVLLLPVYVEMRTAGALNVQPPVETIEKADVALEETKDIQKGAEKANVLFLLDTGSSMTFTPLGTLPEMANAHTGVTGNATPAQAALMLAQATYGHGGLPLVGNNADRYGRDLDQTNNMKTNDTNIDDHPNDYYSPFDYENNPVAAAYSMGNVKLPYALVFKHTKKNWWQNGPPAGTSINVSDLVPNDSRMYKMKLVMWKILEEKTLLENLRFGMATTYQDTNTGSYSADFYKVSPYGAVNNKDTYLINASKNYVYWGKVNFPNGTGPDWATGLPNSEGYGNAVNARWGIDREWYWEQKTTMKWRLVNRAYLRVPIKEYSAEHVDQFRLWIDGFEDVTTGVAAAQYYYKNPELFGDGKTFLSTAIYSGHPSLSRTTLLAQKDVKNVPGIAFSQVSAATETSIMTNTFLNFKAGSGEAVGSVLDFFSPPVATATQGMSTVPSPGSAHNVFKAPPSSFPLIDECEKNWLVIFTAGDDSSEYSSAAAVKALYEYTRDNRLTKLKQRTTGANNSNNTFEPIKLDDGVRTLVVGFVDKDSNDPNVVTLRKRLNDMAKAGDPGNDAAEAFFANDVEGLIDAMRKVLARINREIQPEEGSMLEGDSLDGDMLNEYDSTKEEMFNLYGASYRVNIYDQWEGKVSRYLVAKDNTTGELRMDDDAKPKWEVGDKLLSRRNSSPVSAARDLVFWKGAGNSGKNYEALEYTELNASGYRNPHPDVTSYNINLAPPIASMDNTILGGGNTNWNQRMHPSRALVNWYYGYEVSYGHASGQDKKYARRYMLPDLGDSGIAKGGPPPVHESLPGYRIYANDPVRQALPHKLYFHTNDGLLHVVDAKTGTENMAILPPSSLLNYKLFGLKATHDATFDRYRWINVDDFLTTTSDDIPITSHPSFTLDGPVQKFYMDMSGQGLTDGTGWKAKLVATLGHAGGGIYMMDVSDPAAPAFEWYREMYEDKNRTLHLYRLDNSKPSPPDPTETTANGADPAFWTAVAISGDLYPFYQLGFNSPKPHFGVAKHEPDHTYPNGYYNIIALGGGAQNYLDLSRNGTVGAAFYLIDPDVKYHSSSTTYPTPGIRVFNSGSVAKAGSDWRDGSSAAGANIPNPYMGMVVTEPIFFASQANNYIARGVFTADNRGSIFYVSFVDYATDQHLSRDDWNIRTIATLRKTSSVSTDCYALPLGVVAGSRVDRSDKWVAGGTSNVGTKGKTQDNDTMMRNEDQLIFSFKLPEMKDSDSENYGMTRRSEWTSLGAGDGNSCIEQGARGWYIPLEKESASYGEEYVTTAPVMINGKLYIATFQEKRYTDGAAPCESEQKNGRARLYAVGMDTGMAATWAGGDSKYLEFRGIKITGLTHSEKGKKDTLLVHYEMLDAVEAASSVNDNTTAEDSLKKSPLPNTLVITELGGSARTTNVTSNDQVVNYWRYIE